MIADELTRIKRQESFKYAPLRYALNSIFKWKSSTIFTSVDDERDLQSLRLADIEIICTLGVGGFGRVELVIKLNSFFFKCIFSSFRFKTYEIRRSIVLNKWKNNISSQWNNKNMWWMNEILW
jgi:hypothetical protein